MDSMISIVGDGFVMSAADTQAARSVVVMKEDMDKILDVDGRKTMAMAGEWGDAVTFTQFIQKNVHLDELKSGIPMTTAAVANFTRSELATALRKSPYNVNLLLAGVDQTQDGPIPSLYYLDYLGTCHKMDYTAQGYASFFVLSTLDRHWLPGMTQDQAADLMRKCIAELQMRFIINQPNFMVKIVDSEGVKKVDLAQGQPMPAAMQS